MRGWSPAGIGRGVLAPAALKLSDLIGVLAGLASLGHDLPVSAPVGRGLIVIPKGVLAQQMQYRPVAVHLDEPWIQRDGGFVALISPVIPGQNTCKR
jgi:hypothetical protein